MSSMFTNGPGDQGSISGHVIPKTQKWYLMLPCLTLTIIRYGSRVSETIHLSVVTIKKGAFDLPSTAVTNFTNLLFTYNF